jgi:hypothetical protein
MATSIPFPSPAPSIRFYTSDQLATFPPATWLVEDICQQDSQVMVYGASGDGKSFVALDLALSVAAGREWHGHAVSKGLVVYIAAEGGRGIQRRIAAWQRHHQCVVGSEAFFALDAPQLTDRQQLHGLISAIRQHGIPVLIVLDTLARTFVGKEENSAKDAGEWIAAAARLQGEFNATVMTVHHTGKAKKTERGSGAFRGALDTAIVVKKSGNTITVSCDKQKDEEEFESLALTLTTVDLPSGESSCVLVDGASPGLSNAGLTRTNLRMLRGLASCSSTPAPVADWRDVVNNDGQGAVSIRTFDRWRKELVNEYVVSPYNGHYELTTAGKSAIAKQPPLSATT